MPPTQHNYHEYKLAERVPRAAESIGVVGNTCAEANGAERGHGVEEDGVEVEAGGGDGESGAFDNRDDKEADEQPPGVGG